MIMLCITANAFAQNCIRLLPPTAFTGPDANGKYTLTVRYETDGTKTLETIIRCSSSIILTDCFTINGTGTRIFSNLVCTGGLGSLSARFIPHTGSCNSAQCAPTLTIPEGGALPVKLTNFSASRTKQNVSLQWSTDVEMDTKEFIVEKTESNDYTAVGTVQAVGNSSLKNTYFFTDINKSTLKSFYRLKIVDLNGTITYSEIKMVKGGETNNDVVVFPNPVRANAKLFISGDFLNSALQIIDLSGKVLKNINNIVVNSIDLSGLHSGTYLLRITNKKTNIIINKAITISN